MASEYAQINDLRFLLGVLTVFRIVFFIVNVLIATILIIPMSFIILPTHAIEYFQYKDDFETINEWMMNTGIKDIKIESLLQGIKDGHYQYYVAIDNSKKCLCLYDFKRNNPVTIYQIENIIDIEVKNAFTHLFGIPDSELTLTSTIVSPA